MSSGADSRGVLLALPLALLLSVPAIGGLGSVGPTRPYRMPPNLLEYFKSRYTLAWNDSMTSTLVATADGPQGTLDVNFKSARTAPVAVALADEQADAIARAVMQNEAALLDIPDMSEIRKLEFSRTDDGLFIAHYQRFIGGIRLDQEVFRLHVDPAGTVTRLYATLVPTPIALYQAVDRTPIAREQVREIVEQELAAHGAHTSDEPELVATSRPPHVVWQAGGRFGPPPQHFSWSLALDAFTGRIEKRFCSDTRQYIRAPAPGQPTPCDAFLKGEARKGPGGVTH